MARRSGVEVRAGNTRPTGALFPGLNWIVTEAEPTPFRVAIRPASGGPAEIVALRSLDPSLRVPPGWSWDGKAVISSHTWVEGDQIKSTYHFINPLCFGKNLGVTYEEPVTKGFCMGGIVMPARFHKVELAYSAKTRELRESIDGSLVKSGKAREAEGLGIRIFQVGFAHGAETDYLALLFEYWVEAGKPILTWASQKPCAFDLKDR